MAAGSCKAAEGGLPVGSGQGPRGSLATSGLGSEIPAVLRSSIASIQTPFLIKGEREA